MLKKITKVVFRSISEIAYAAWMFLFGFWSLSLASSYGTIVLVLFLTLGAGLWMYEEDIVDRCKTSIAKYEEERTAASKAPEAKASPSTPIYDISHMQPKLSANQIVIDINDTPPAT